MKVIWTGTDSLYLVSFPKVLRWTKIFYIVALRLYGRITDFFTQEHYVCGELVERNLRKFKVKKPIVQFKDLINFCLIDKVEHEGFNILYYFPEYTRFNQWLYGWDIFIEITLRCPDFNFLVVNGRHDLSKIYPYTDLLIRPNRHDGHSRMIDECIINEIPYVWTKENPTIEYFIDQITKIYENQTSNPKSSQTDNQEP